MVTLIGMRDRRIIHEHDYHEQDSEMDEEEEEEEEERYHDSRRSIQHALDSVNNRSANDNLLTLLDLPPFANNIFNNGISSPIPQVY